MSYLMGEVSEFAVMFKATMGGHTREKVPGGPEWECVQPEEGLGRCGVSGACPLRLTDCLLCGGGLEQDLLKCRPRLWGHRWNSAGCFLLDSPRI